MNNCYGCLKENVDGYCNKCKKEIFEGKNINPDIHFDGALQKENSLLIEKNRLQLSDDGEQSNFKLNIYDENDSDTFEAVIKHLTMQIAKQIYKFQTMPSALVRINETKLGLLNVEYNERSETLSLDVLMNEEEKEIINANFNGIGISKILKNKIPAYKIEIEKYFKLIIFNYLFGVQNFNLNHLNFYRAEDFGDNIFAPFNNLKSTFLPGNNIEPLQLFENESSEKVKEEYTLDSISEFGLKIGINSVRLIKLIELMISKPAEVEAIVNRSLLDENEKEMFFKSYLKNLSNISS